MGNKKCCTVAYTILSQVSVPDRSNRWLLCLTSPAFAGNRTAKPNLVINDDRPHQKITILPLYRVSCYSSPDSSAAIPRKAKKPIISVTVVRMMEDACAGS